MNSPSSVLVVGAGPTGLTLALQAHDHGARVRVVDRAASTAPSRALIVHSRTLEGLRPLGVVGPLLQKADVHPVADIHLGGRVVRASLDKLALADTAFPHLTLVRQADVEAVLTEALERRGIRIERSTAAVDVHDCADGTLAVLRSDTATEKDCFDFVVGCDGQKSLVRQTAGIAWQGGGYADAIILADLDLEGDLDAHVAHVFVGGRGVLLLFALGERASWRLLATRPAVESGPIPCGPHAELQALLKHVQLPVRVTHIAWSARYPLQLRLAQHFKQGRVFVAGDAAHAQSPALGQGMNLGIQDALNLGWKLAFAASAESGERLLDSYECERRPFDRRVLALTHLAFWAESGSGAISRFLRSRLAPLALPVLPALLQCRPLVAAGIRFVAQLDAGYGQSPISMDYTPPLRRWPAPGARLADRTVEVGDRSTRLHALLASPGVHVLLERDAQVPDELSLGPLVRVHRLSDVPGIGLVAVRPDGYVGMRASLASEAHLRTWLAGVGALGPN